MEFGFEPFEPALISLSMVVPLAVPSVIHNSLPLVAVVARNSILPFKTGPNVG